jgi:hypothetical protein
VTQFPQSLLTIEVYREAATMVMLIGVAPLSASKTSARWLAFLWVFALWDIAYYAGLWVTVRWPASFTDLDVLFLIPVPWIAQVWFPLLVSFLTVVAIALCSFEPGIPGGGWQSCKCWLLITLHYGHLARTALLLQSRLWGSPVKSSQPTE